MHTYKDHPVQYFQFHWVLPKVQVASQKGISCLCGTAYSVTQFTGPTAHNATGNPTYLITSDHFFFSWNVTSIRVDKANDISLKYHSSDSIGLLGVVICSLHSTNVAHPIRRGRHSHLLTFRAEGYLLSPYEGGVWGLTGLFWSVTRSSMVNIFTSVDFTAIRLKCVNLSSLIV